MPTFATQLKSQMKCKVLNNEPEPDRLMSLVLNINTDEQTIQEIYNHLLRIDNRLNKTDE